VIRAYRLVRQAVAAQLVLAGGGAADDPEGREVLAEVRAEAGGDADVHVLELPADAHVAVNALQRRATIVVQKSIREGFGLTVTEALWKSRPVVAGDTGGIRVQVASHRTGFLVHTPEGAAHRMRYLLDDPALMERMGSEGREFVRENYLLTRHLREYLTLLLVARHGEGTRSIEV
jgi:trehalose synthase